LIGDDSQRKPLKRKGELLSTAHLNPRNFSRLVGTRKLRPQEPLWTFWDYKRERWPADEGMRFDHFLRLSKMSERLVDGSVDRWVRGEDNASDHAPAWITLKLYSFAERSWRAR